MTKQSDEIRFAELCARKQRLETAQNVMREGGDISGFLDAAEYAEVKQVANTAAENRLAAMLKQAKSALEMEFGQ